MIQFQTFFNFLGEILWKNSDVSGSSYTQKPG